MKLIGHRRVGITTRTGCGGFGTRIELGDEGFTDFVDEQLLLCLFCLLGLFGLLRLFRLFLLFIALGAF